MAVNKPNKISKVDIEKSSRKIEPPDELLKSYIAVRKHEKISSQLGENPASVSDPAVSYNPYQRITRAYRKALNVENSFRG